MPHRTAIAEPAVVFAPHHRVDSSTAKAFEQDLINAVDRGDGYVVVDCSNLDYISSAGLRAVLIGAKGAKEKGGKLVLCGMRGHVRKVFDTSGFSKILPILDSQDAALASL